MVAFFPNTGYWLTKGFKFHSQPKLAHILVNVNLRARLCRLGAASG